MSILDRQRVVDLAKRVVAADPKRLSVVKGEKDDSPTTHYGAATFVKLNGRRLGRDLEMYSFMGESIGPQETVAMILEEVVLPLKVISHRSFKVGIAQLRLLKVFGDKDAAWQEFLDDVSCT